MTSFIEDRGTVSGEPGPYPEGNPVSLFAQFEDGTTPVDWTTVLFRVRNPDGTVSSFTFPAANIEKLGVGSYRCDLGVPDAEQSHYEAVGKDADGLVQVTLPGEFFVTPSSVDVPTVPPGPVLGPGLTWINGEDLTNCPGFDPTADPQLADAAAVEASMVLYELSARQFAGRVGPITVRPVWNQGFGCWGGAGDWSYGGYIWMWLDGVGGYGWSGEQGELLGPLSRVKLSGYPVREITQVKINGEVLSPTYTDGAPTYRLDGWRALTRMDNPDEPSLQKQWPIQQNLALNDDQPGTFSISYTFGVDPPIAGIAAARQLACQLLLAQQGKACQLPTGVTKITGNGVTMERGVLGQWARDPKSGAWITGLVLVDTFLAAYNGRGLRRRPAVLGDATRYAPILGEQSL